MTTPVPEKYDSTPKRRKNTEPKARLSMSIYGFLLAWLVPNIVMAGIVVILNLLPLSDTVGDMTPLLTIVGLSGLILGLPLALLTNWLLRYQLNQSVHILAYAVIGMLYGLTVLLAGGEGLIPLLIPLVGFPAAILMALGRWTASSFVHVIEPAGESTADSTE
ncbi:hypothetical protein [Enteractinococcus helveticum]|uniref:Uncharacterized protein n=1 Tax=Enteractinococcus helveticum TaxID=1837282 RepID=A0A1B7M3G8_9MICC|nr:hypothetical protein [Enteractinococcus helveticum]OAV63146.1 hypothetical protein A6F49_03050 [Enteractinococcus helveticum]